MGRERGARIGRDCYRGKVDFELDLEYMYCLCRQREREALWMEGKECISFQKEKMTSVKRCKETVCLEGSIFEG